MTPEYNIKFLVKEYCYVQQYIVCFEAQGSWMYTSMFGSVTAVHTSPQSEKTEALKLLAWYATLICLSFVPCQQISPAQWLQVPEQTAATWH